MLSWTVNMQISPGQPPQMHLKEKVNIFYFFKNKRVYPLVPKMQTSFEIFLNPFSCSHAKVKQFFANLKLLGQQCFTMSPWSTRPL